MFRKMIGALLLLCILLAGTALAQDEYPQPYTGDMVGTWGFNGGAEEHGDGFRLNADGTGVWLEIVDYEQVPLQYREMDRIFTWVLHAGGGCTLLAETTADGRVSTYEIETWGDARIHIPNGISGGFYYPVLDDDLRIYLADQAERSAFDGVLADYLDGSITAKLESAGLSVGEIYLQQSEGAWRIVVKTYDRDTDMEHRFLLDEQYIDVYADDFVWLWGDYDLGQRWFAPDETAQYYTGLPGILQSYMAWIYAPQPTQEPAQPSLPELTAQLGTFPKNQRYEVYEALVGGDDEPNRRAGNGKAAVSTNGDIWVYATWKGMLLVEYELSGGHSRIGWIDAGQLPDTALEGVPELPWNRDTEQNIYGVVTRDTYLTDDPHWNGIDPSILASVPAGTSTRCLGTLGTEVLVECFVNNEIRMGFVGRDFVDTEYGYAANPERQIGRNTRYTEADVASAFDALAQFIFEAWPGTGLAAVRYDENDADEANSYNAWWTDDTGTREGILLLADLSSMELYHFEIGGSLARDYIFILYREPGGQWEVCNWGYT